MPDSNAPEFDFRRKLLVKTIKNAVEWWKNARQQHPSTD